MDTVEKSVAATETPRCTVPYSGVERAGGEYAGAVEWPSAALSPECALGYLHGRSADTRPLDKSCRTRALARSAPGHMIGVKVEGDDQADPFNASAGRLRTPLRHLPTPEQGDLQRGSIA